MGNPFVLVQEQGADEALLDWAERLYKGTGSEIIIARIIDEDKFRSKLEKGAHSDVGAPNITELEDHAERVVQDLIEERTSSCSTEYVPIGRVGNIPDDVFELANEHGCDHLFVQTARRSPTGKAIFGDVAQTLILNFEGATTVLVGNK